MGQIWNSSVEEIFKIVMTLKSCMNFQRVSDVVRVRRRHSVEQCARASSYKIIPRPTRNSKSRTASAMRPSSNAWRTTSKLYQRGRDPTVSFRQCLNI